MSTDERGRSPELEQVRQMLFPELSEEEGRAEIEAAIRGQSDPKRWKRIEQRAAKDLSGDLLAILHRLREEQPDEKPD
jgi:hypothetical protein